MNTIRTAVSSCALFIMCLATPAQASVFDLTCAGCELTGNHVLRAETDGSIQSSAAVALPGTAGEFDFFLFGFATDVMVAHDVNLYWNPGTYTFDSMGDFNNPPETSTSGGVSRPAGSTSPTSFPQNST